MTRQEAGPPISKKRTLDTSCIMSQMKISTFILVKSGNSCLSIPPEAPFYWKFLRIGIQRAKDMRKDGLIFKV